MASQKRREDRRMQRTRQVLQRAFVDVVREKAEALRSLPEMEKGFAATSIQEITAQANVNRGTFYLHFMDNGVTPNSGQVHFPDQAIQRKRETG
jgi:AcrR family transcriptional regulator